MNASFIGLFRRGKLGSLRPGFGSKGDKIPHEQRERFAVAALGFTLRHSKPFRRWFLKEIVELPQHLHSKEIEITMDENQWSDLKITSEGAEGFLCVVEAKTGAPLAKHQNPTHKTAFLKDGYGRQLLKQKARGMKVTYCVLDIAQRPGPRTRNGIKCLYKTWHTVADRAPRSDTIVPDFVELLIHLGLPLSRSKNSKHMKTSTLRISDICHLQEELNAIGSHYDLKIRNKEKCGSRKDPYLGTDFAFKKQALVLGMKANALRGWFGWHVIDGTLNCELWFDHSPTTSIGAHIFRYLKDKKLSPDKVEGGGSMRVIKTPSTLTGDVLWFRSIFDGMVK